MWLLVLFMMGGNAPSFAVHPNVFDEKTCLEAKAVVEKDIQSKLLDKSKMTATFRCIPWGPK